MPENIRYGVTITPPDGDPVTGTAIPFFDYTNCYFCGLTADFTGSTTSNFSESKGTNIISSYHNVTSSSALLSVQLPIGNYNAEFYWCNGSETPGSITHNFTTNSQNTNISITANGKSAFKGFENNNCYQTTRWNFAINDDSGASNSRTLTISNPNHGNFALLIYPYTNNELSEENIIEGVTINGITGTMKGNNGNKSIFTFCASARQYFWGDYDAETGFTWTGGTTISAGKCFFAVPKNVVNYAAKVNSGTIGIVEYHTSTGGNQINNSVTASGISEFNGNNSMGYENTIYAMGSCTPQVNGNVIIIYA